MGRMQRLRSNTGCYHIMLRGNERKHIFLDDGDREKLLAILARKKDETGLAIYAFCLMSNHVHLVIRDEHNCVSGIMRGIATSYAMFFNNKYERVGHVFQDRLKASRLKMIGTCYQ